MCDGWIVKKPIRRYYVAQSEGQYGNYRGRGERRKVENENFYELGQTGGADDDWIGWLSQWLKMVNNWGGWGWSGCARLGPSLSSIRSVFSSTSLLCLLVSDDHTLSNGTLYENEDWGYSTWQMQLTDTGPGITGNLPASPLPWQSKVVNVINISLLKSLLWYWDLADQGHLRWCFLIAVGCFWEGISS